MATPMTLSAQLGAYAQYHRDPRNIRTHLWGIPMIVLGIATVLAAPAWTLGAWTITPGWLLWAAVTLAYYMPLGLATGLGMGALLAVFTAVGHLLALAPMGWAWGLALLAVGWVLQFVGHFWEGRKPAFADDVRGLLQGPLFVVCEVLFALGLLRPLREAVETQAGPVRLR